MKPLGSIAAMVLGAGLTGLVFCGIVLANFPHDHTMPLMGMAAGLGAGLGAVVVLPVVLGEALRLRRPVWLDRHAFRLSWYLSVMMVGSMGYLLACSRYGRMDDLGLIACALVFVGAMGKTCLESAYEKPRRWARGR